MGSLQADKTLDLRLIPEYDGSAKQSISEWLEKVELVCKLRGVDGIASVIPLRLTGGAFAVYLQLANEDRKSFKKVREVLLAAFAVDPFVAYEQFVTRRLGVNEQPDVFLAELRRLASLFGGVSEKALACAFVAGLPESVRQLLRAGSRMEDLGLIQILSRARAVIVDEGPLGLKDTCLGAKEFRVESRAVASRGRCFSCGGLNHFARNCPNGQRDSDSNKKNHGRGSRPRAQNHCRKSFSVAAAKMHQGNALGEEVIVPTSFPPRR
uniref:CCHC-type domain-containing protein n=1 Tax=Trichuris muris TaxID=70415 RepID=A0A5S6Q5R6_TRIMR